MVMWPNNHFQSCQVALDISTNPIDFDGLPKISMVSLQVCTSGATVRIPRHAVCSLQLTRTSNILRFHFSSTARKAFKITRNTYAKLQALYPNVFKGKLLCPFKRNKNLTNYLVSATCKLNCDQSMIDQSHLTLQVKGHPNEPRMAIFHGPGQHCSGGLLISKWWFEYMVNTLANLNHNTWYYLRGKSQCTSWA